MTETFRRIQTLVLGGDVRVSDHGFEELEEQMIRKSTKLFREGKYAAEVVIELLYDDESWSPTMSLDDARKLDTVRLALQRGDIAEAARHGRVFELTPVAAK